MIKRQSYLSAAFLLLLVIVGGCLSKKKSENFSGIYRIKSKSYKSNIQDTIYADQNQVKLYTDKFYAYSNLKEDSTASFGFGTYSINKDQLVEHNIYSTSALDSPISFQLIIQPTKLGYIQTIPDIRIKGVPTRLIESYTQIPAEGKSPLDGTWKLTSTLKISGKDTLVEHKIQYKIFQRGYFLFIQTFKTNDTSKTMKNGFGFGTFELNNGELNETNIFSTYHSLMQKPVLISVEIQDSDNYTQSFQSESEHLTVVEQYKRILP